MSAESSRQAFLEAMTRLLTRGAELGVNAVSREAGLNKVLLYRYFGSWEGLLAEFARSINPWRDLRSEAQRGLAEGRWSSRGPFLKWMFHRFLDRLYHDVVLQTVLRRSFVKRDPIQSALEEDREREGAALLEIFGVHFKSQEPDPAAMAALLTGGLAWVVLVGKQSGTFNGLTFQDDEGYRRLSGALDSWVDALTNPPTKS